MRCYRRPSPAGPSARGPPNFSFIGLSSPSPPPPPPSEGKPVTRSLGPRIPFPLHYWALIIDLVRWSRDLRVRLQGQHGLRTTRARAMNIYRGARKGEPGGPLAFLRSCEILWPGRLGYVDWDPWYLGMRWLPMAFLGRFFVMQSADGRCCSVSHIVMDGLLLLLLPGLGDHPSYTVHKPMDPKGEIQSQVSRPCLPGAPVCPSLQPNCYNRRVPGMCVCSSSSPPAHARKKFPCNNAYFLTGVHAPPSLRVDDKWARPRQRLIR